MKQTVPPTQAILYWQQHSGLDLRVEQHGELRTLLINGQRQSQFQLQQPGEVFYPHLQVVLDFLAQQPWQHLLQFGLGGGELNRACQARWPERQLTTVEAIPEIITLYQQFFSLDLPAGEAETPAPVPLIIQADAGQFCATARAKGTKYDAIFIDVYPFPELWEPLLCNCAALLHDAGWLLINVPQAQLPANFTEACQRMDPAWRKQAIPGYANQLVFIQPSRSATEYKVVQGS